MKTRQGMLIRLIFLVSFFFASTGQSKISTKIRWNITSNGYSLTVTEATVTGDNMFWPCPVSCNVWMDTAIGESDSISIDGIAGFRDKTLAKKLLNHTFTRVSPGVEPGQNACTKIIIHLSSNNAVADTPCAIVPRAPVTCTLSDQNITFSYGEIAASDINNASRLKQIYFQCSGKTTLSIKATNAEGTNNVIKLDDNLSSSLAIDNINGAEGVVKKDITSTSVMLSSTLNATGPLTSGTKTGSGVLKVNIE